MERNYWKKAFVILCFVFLLMSCSNVGQIPTAKSTIILKNTLSPTLSPIPTKTIQPTKTLTSTPIKSNTPTPKPSNDIFLTPTIPSVTLQALATLDSLVTAFPELEEFYSWECMIYPCYTPGLGLSPNGKWAVFFGAKDSGGLKIASVDRKKLWDVDYSELSGTTCPPCGDALVTVEHWSLDGKYLYVSPVTLGDGGYGWFWQKDKILIRLNLFDGSWVDTKKGSAYSFSPKDQFIAYRTDNGVHIYEFITRDERVFSVPNDYVNFGRFVWSPDNKRIIFVAATREDPGEEPNGFTTFLIDLENNSISTLLENDGSLLYPLAWAEGDQIEMGDLLNGGWKEKYYLDLDKKEFFPPDSP